MAPRIFYPRKRRRAFRMRSIPRKSETLGNRPWRMGWPPAKAQERGGRRRVGAAHPPAAGRSPAAGLFEGQGPGPRTPPPPPGPRAAPWPRGTVAHGRSGGPVGGAGGPGRRYGGAAAFGGRGGRPCGAAPRPAKQKRVARGQRPRARLFQGASRPAAAPPPPPRSPPTPKRQRKSQAPRSTGPGARNHGRKVRGTGPTPRVKPLPMPYGQRRNKPLAAGY